MCGRGQGRAVVQFGPIVFYADVPMYPIIPVPTDAPTDIEALGSKRKFWFKRPVDDASGEKESWLFKAAREHTGEDWSEKVAAELSALLGLPHATYELAQWTEGAGSESRTWTGT